MLELRGSALFFNQVQQATGSGFDARNAGEQALMVYRCIGNSAVFDLQAAADGVSYLTFATVSAASNTTGSGQHSAYYPWVRAVARAMYSAAGGSATLSIFWQAKAP